MTSLKTTRMHRKSNLGFTLIEILVVLGVIAILVGITLPGIIDIFSSGSEGQAYSVTNSLLRTARAYAIENSVYTAVHFQPADRDLEEFSDRWSTFASIMAWNEEDGYFQMPAGFEPVAIPGGMAVGAVDDRFFNSDGSIKNITQPEKLVTATVIFSPEGKVVRWAPTSNGHAKFDLADGALFDKDDDLRIWDNDNSTWNMHTLGVTAVTFFPLQEYMSLTNTSSRTYFLQDKAAFTGINLYTGQLFPRK